MSTMDALVASSVGRRLLAYMVFVCCHASKDVPLDLLGTECGVDEYIAYAGKQS